MRILLTLLLASIMLAASGAPTQAVAGECTTSEIQIGGCPSVGGTIVDNEVILNGNQPGIPGNGNSGPNGNGNGNGNGNSASNGSNGTAQPPPVCNPQIAPCVDRGAFTVTSLPVPTLDDIAAFRPTPGVDHMEPNGWFVVGLDANFYATGGASVVNGTLLGYDASVRFTPIRWQWFYGDGATATTSTKGGTWKSLGIAEFDPTPTSHVYSVPGTYYIDLTIGYRAEYSFNGSTYAPIVGTLWLPANRLVATVGSAKTVLVERDCTVNPAGPGCSN